MVPWSVYSPSGPTCRSDSVYLNTTCQTLVPTPQLCAVKRLERSLHAVLRFFGVLYAMWRVTYLVTVLA
jgi:hypothetical protein